MNLNSFIVYTVAILVGGLSYSICLNLARSRPESSIEKYLFDGNSYYRCIFSIMGSIFSVAVTFTNTPAMIIFYGMSVEFVAITSVIAIIALLRKKLNEIAKNGMKASFSALPHVVYTNPQESTKNNTYTNDYFALNIMYLGVALVAEIAAFRFGLIACNVEPIWAIFTTLFVVLLTASYVYVGGFLGVLITDTIQVILMGSVGCPLIVYFYYKHNTQIPSLLDCGTLHSIAAIASAYIITITWLSSGPEIWLRLLTLPTPKNQINDDHYRISMYSVAGIGLILSVPTIILLGFFERASNAPSYSDSYFLWKLLTTLDSPIVMRICFLILVVSAIFSTLSTLYISLTQCFYAFEKNQNHQANNSRKDYRSITFSITAIAYVVSSVLEIEDATVVGLLAFSINAITFFFIYVHPASQFRFVVPRRSSVYSTVISAIVASIFVHRLIRLGDPIYYMIPLISFFLYIFYSLAFSVTSKMSDKHKGNEHETI